MRNLTEPRVRTAQAILASPGETHQALDIIKRTGLKPGVVYNVLVELVNDKWLTPCASKKMRRKSYELTDVGFEGLTSLLETAVNDERFAHLFKGTVR